MQSNNTKRNPHHTTTQEQQHYSLHLVMPNSTGHTPTLCWQSSGTLPGPATQPETWHNPNLRQSLLDAAAQVIDQALADAARFSSEKQ